MGSEVATFQTIMAVEHIFPPEDHEKPVRFNAYKVRLSDPVNAQQLVSNENVRISWIHLQPKSSQKNSRPYNCVDQRKNRDYQGHYYSIFYVLMELGINRNKTGKSY
uniref:Uncharacterized protein n=1 Tax=Daphnia galeata TaxID=27404 RepID=A0A8J2RFL4_9CRUS|nr:unnamed protein product [Daphnia galeata]